MSEEEDYQAIPPGLLVPGFHVEMPAEGCSGAMPREEESPPYTPTKSASPVFRREPSSISGMKSKEVIEF